MGGLLREPSVLEPPCAFRYSLSEVRLATSDQVRRHSMGRLLDEHSLVRAIHPGQWIQDRQSDLPI